MKRFGYFFLIFYLSLSGCDLGPHVKWEGYTPAKMAEALKSGKPTIAYFYAAWCGPCMKLKYDTFTDARVVRALEPFARIKVDMSYSHSKQIIEIAEHYQIQGFPTIVFFNSAGEEITRFSGFVSANRLLRLIKQESDRLGFARAAASE